MKKEKGNLNHCIIGCPYHGLWKVSQLFKETGALSRFLRHWEKVTKRGGHTHGRVCFDHPIAVYITI